MLCPANMLGYLSAVRPARSGRRRSSIQLPASRASFRAERPASLLLREAPGRAVEESLFAFDFASQRAGPAATVTQRRSSNQTFADNPEWLRRTSGISPRSHHAAR